MKWAGKRMEGKKGRVDQPKTFEILTCSPERGRHRMEGWEKQAI